MKKFYKKGFTLIELIIVITIIGVLTALILPNFMSGRIRARDTALKSDARALKQALQLYYNDFQDYPNDVAPAYYDIAGCGAAGTTDCGIRNGSSFETTTTIYMKNPPDTFRYYKDASNDSFVIELTLENVSDEDITSSQSLCSCPVGAPATCCSESFDYCVCPD